ncbi:MAG: PIG-L family deacetylase [Lentisphaeria bacterium]
MISEQRRFLFFGAHPDDPDLLFGGTAIQLTRAGHAVKFVAACNGDCGHYAMTSEDLAIRRSAEAQASAKIAGLAEYEILPIRDCQLECTLKNREEFIRIIRRFQPDVVISHRACDYHPDHRNTAQLVMDSAYLVKVPLYCPDTPIPAKSPVFAYSYDRFTDPRPIRADAAVAFDSVLETKLAMVQCHQSQFFEWLPWDKGCKDFKQDSMSAEQQRQWILEQWGERFKMAANLARETLIQTYGDAGSTIQYAEVFELSPYGAPVSIEEFRKLFQV